MDAYTGAKLNHATYLPFINARSPFLSDNGFLVAIALVDGMRATRF